MRADQLVADRYRLVDLIAVGGMGEVWRATDQRLGRLVAVKLLKPEYGREPSFLERFRAEARHAAGLSHPGIAAVYDYGETQDDGQVLAYLVMELVDGEPLSQLLAREGALPAKVALQIVGQAGLALQAAHDAGVIHRDVKPANLLIVRHDPTDPSAVTVKITDFGIARAIDSAPLTRTGMVMGTAHYLSPEQARAGQVTPASDVYSLGVVAFECLVGRRPFTGDTAFAIAAAHATTAPPPLPADLPVPVRTLVEQALAKAPQGRPASAGAFGRTALALAVTYSTLPASSSTVPAEATTRLIPVVPADVAPPTRLLPAAPAPSRPRRPVWPWLVLLLVVLVAAGLAFALSNSGTGTPSPGTTPSPSVHTSVSPTRTSSRPTTHATTTRVATTTPHPTTTAAPTTTTAPTTTSPPAPTSPATTGATTPPPSSAAATGAASGAPAGKAIGKPPTPGRRKGKGHGRPGG